jgi:hypothetical protein
MGAAQMRGISWVACSVTDDRNRAGVTFRACPRFRGRRPYPDDLTAGFPAPVENGAATGSASGGQPAHGDGGRNRRSPRDPFPPDRAEVPAVAVLHEREVSECTLTNDPLVGG